MSNPNLNFSFSKARLRTIHKVQFGIIDPEVIVSHFPLLTDSLYSPVSSQRC